MNRERLLVILPVAVIAAYYIWNLCFIGVAGNFPLNDDWQYARSVKDFLETGAFHLVGCSPSCALQIVMGAAVCKPFGFSHETLRLLNVLLGWLSSLALYFTLRELRAGRRLALLGALMYAVNPVVLNLTFSFMTDTAAVTFSTLYFLFVIRWLKRQRPADLVLTSLMLIAGVSIRQTIAAYIAANGIIVVGLFLKRRAVWMPALALIVVPVIAAFSVEHLMAVNNDFPQAYAWYKGQLLALLKRLVRTPLPALFSFTVESGRLFLYLGLFLVPLMVPFLSTLRDLVRKNGQIVPLWFVLSAAMITAMMTKMVAIGHRLMPFVQNILRIPMLGSLTIMGVAIPVLSDRFRVWLTYISALSAFLIVALILAGTERAVVGFARAVRRRSAASGSAWLIGSFVFLSTAVSYALVLSQTMIVGIDRYYVMPLVPVIMSLCLLSRWLRLSRPGMVSWALVVVMALYSSCAQQDYMSWNRARWQAIADLEKQGVKAGEIDGGMEYDFWNDVKLGADLDLSGGHYLNVHRGAKPRSDWRWWSINGERYIISFSPIPQYENVATHRYFSALSMSMRDLYTLKAIEPEGAKASP